MQYERLLLTRARAFAIRWRAAEARRASEETRSEALAVVAQARQVLRRRRELAARLATRPDAAPPAVARRR